MKTRKIISVILALTLIFTALPVASNAVALAAGPDTVRKGVDVSRWNGNIDWSKMKDTGVTFAVLRCYSYGKDMKFDEYYDGAAAEGMDIGAYVFMYATSEDEAVKEANAALKALDGRALDFPLFLDIEYEKLPSLGVKKLTDIALTELKLFKKAGYKVGIYASKNFINNYLDMERLSEYYLWTAKWSLTSGSGSKKFYFKNMDPYSSSRPEGDMWQFTEKGAGAYYGVESGYIDLDYCYVDFGQAKPTQLSKKPEDHTMPQQTLFYDKSGMLENDGVAWVQAVLYNLGFTDSVTGVYDPDTVAAVKDFQKYGGLAVSGIVDSDTAEKMLKAYENKAFSGKIRYNPNNGESTFTAVKLRYGEAFTLGEGVSVEKNGISVGGWTLYRASDKSHYCIDGVWRTKSMIESSDSLKKVFFDGTALCIDDDMLGVDSGESDTFTFTAVWDIDSSDVETFYADGRMYKIYKGNMPYSAAVNYCRQRCGSLATLDDETEFSALRLDGSGKYFIAAMRSAEGYSWFSGETVKYPIIDAADGEGNYLAVSAESLSEPYALFALDSKSEISGFIFESECPHDHLKVKGIADASCSEYGYTGDKVCSDCGAVIAQGEKIKKKPHTYTDFEIKKEATCGNAGEKQKKCTTCGYVYTAEIPKTNAHNMVIKAIQKATTEHSGKAYEKCSECGFKTDEQTVKKVKGVKLEYTSVVYSGSEKKPKVTVTDSSGKALSENKDYTVSYKKNKNVGTAEVIVKLKGKYEGSLTATFKIIPKAISISDIAVKNKAVTLKWKKPSKSVTGYVIEYSTSSKFSENVKTVKVKDQKVLTKTVKNLKSGATLYFRIRAYKTVNGKNYYSEWSKSKKIKVG